MHSFLTVVFVVQIITDVDWDHHCSIIRGKIVLSGSTKPIILCNRFSKKPHLITTIVSPSVPIPTLPHTDHICTLWLHPTWTTVQFEVTVLWLVRAAAKAIMRLATFLTPLVHHHHHRHVPEGLGMFPVPWSSRWSWSIHLFLGRPMFFFLLVYIVVLVLVVSLCPSSVRVVATFPGTVLFPLLCSLLQFFA